MTRSRLTRTVAPVVAVAVIQAVLVAVAVAPRLSANLRGQEYRMRVQPVDPIDPFRGAYVQLNYPDLELDDGRRSHEDGRLYIRLVERNGYWVSMGQQTTRPTDTPYLTCQESSWEVSCGIESWFTNQDEALRLERVVADGAVATVKIDDRGNAAIVELTD
jgi:uncharacterized membrane-anchored protein